MMTIFDLAGSVRPALRYPDAFPMTNQVYDERGAFAEIAPRWRDLLASDPAATIFQTPEYAGVWWQEFGALRCLALTEVVEAGVLRGIVPLSMEPDGSVHFVGDPSITDYLAPVSRMEDRDAVSAAAVESAMRLDGFTSLSLSGLPGDSGWPEALARAAKAAGLTVREEPEDVCPIIATTGSWDGYLANLSGKQRHEIRRKARRLDDNGGYSVRVSTAESLDADLSNFFAFHRSSEGSKGKFMHDDMAVYFVRLATAMQERGLMRLAMLDLAGEPVAGIYGFSDGVTWSIYNSAYNAARRDLAPGMVLVAETIRLAAEEGCTTYDFLRGDEEYKYRFGASDRQVIRVIGEPA